MSSYDVKAEVTVNGSGFDTPSQIEISKDFDIPDCSLVFPGRMKSRFKITKKDVVKVYIGLGDIPEYPVFTGFLEDEEGYDDAQMTLYGPWNKGTTDYIRVTDLDNFDGMEISQAIASVKSQITELNAFPLFAEKTSPLVNVPVETWYKNGTSKYDLIKQLRDFCIDDTDPIYLRQYVLFDFDGALYFRKMPNPKTANPSMILRYGDTLLSFDQVTKGNKTINRQMVIGDGDAFATFSNAQRVLIEGVREGKPIKDTDILNNSQALAIARNSVLSSMFKPEGLKIKSHQLLNMIPGVSVVEIQGAPYGLDDKYLVSSLDINLSTSDFSVTAGVTTPTDVLGELMSDILYLNRDYVTEGV